MRRAVVVPLLRVVGVALALPVFVVYVAFRLVLAVAAAAASAYACPYLIIAAFSEEITVWPDTNDELMLLGVLTGLAVFLIARGGGNR